MISEVLLVATGYAKVTLLQCMLMYAADTMQAARHTPIAVHKAQVAFNYGQWWQAMPHSGRSTSITFSSPLSNYTAFCAFLKH